VGQELLPRIEEYGHVTKEAVQRDLLGGPGTAARVVFHLSHVRFRGVQAEAVCPAVSILESSSSAFERPETPLSQMSFFLKC
jgi:hypothetical protein